MAYATYEYYADTFGGVDIPQDAFDVQIRAASDILDAICTIPIDETVNDMDQIAKACCYQAETLYAQGGTKALNGKADGGAAVTERLDDYSITQQQTAEANAKSITLNGIPVSPLALAILRKQGLTARWLYAAKAREWVRTHG